MGEDRQSLAAVEFPGNLRRTDSRTDRTELADGTWSERVTTAFDTAAGRYGQSATAQARVAARFADWTRQMAADVHVNSVLEIGCGTGFLTRDLIGAWPGARWTITDASPAMVEQCRGELERTADRFVSAKCEFRTLDGQSPAEIKDSYNLIVSSLTFQWFADLPEAVGELAGKLRPGGLLAFSTLAAGSFRTARRLAPDAFHRFPSGDELLAAIQSQQWNISTETMQCEEQHAGLIPLLRHLRDIGAGTPQPGTRVPLSQLRAACQESGNAPIRAEYDVLFCGVRRTLAPDLQDS